MEETTIKKEKVSKKDNLKKVYRACLEILVKEDKLTVTDVRKACIEHNNKVLVASGTIVKELRKLIGEEDSIQQQGYGKGTFYSIPKDFPKWKIKTASKMLPNYVAEDAEAKPLPPVDNFVPLEEEKAQEAETAKEPTKPEPKEIGMGEEMIKLFCEQHKIKKEDLNPNVLFYFGRTEPSNREIKRGVFFLESIKSYLQGDESIIPIEALDAIDARSGGKCKNYWSFLFLIYTLGESPWVDFEVLEGQGLRITFLDVDAVNVIQDKLFEAMSESSAKDKGEKCIVEKILKNRKPTEIIPEPEPVKTAVKETNIIPQREEQPTVSKVILKRDLSKVVYVLYALLKSGLQNVKIDVINDLVKSRYNVDLGKETVIAAVHGLEEEGFVKTSSEGINISEENKLDDMLLKYKYQTWYNITLITLKKVDTIQKYTGNVRPVFIGKTVAGDLSIYALLMDIENPSHVNSLLKLYSKQEEDFGESMILPRELEDQFKKTLGIGVTREKGTIEKLLEACETL